MSQESGSPRYPELLNSNEIMKLSYINRCFIEAVGAERTFCPANSETVEDSAQALSRKDIEL